MAQTEQPKYHKNKRNHTGLIMTMRPQITVVSEIKLTATSIPKLELSLTMHLQ